MIGTSTKAPVRFTPSWLEGRADAPVFLLRAGSVIERGQLEAELAGQHQAAQVYGYELRAAFQSGLQTLLAGDPELDRLLELEAAEADEVTQAIEEKRDLVPLPAADVALLTEARKLLAQHWPDFRDLVAQLERRRQLAPIIAFQRFCIGWEGIDVKFARGRDGYVAEAALEALAPMEMMAAGSRAYGLLYAKEQVGNSPPPSGSADGQATSSSDDMSMVDGRSGADAGAKTPA